jgi:N-acetylglucosaminyldiphosphoundecaprenol N-acetyl-beta-D-mannosaminyltransferase
MTRSSSGPRLTQLLGVPVEALTIPELNQRISSALREKRRLVIGNQNLHSIAIYHQQEAMRAFYAAADCVHIDGMPLVWWGRFLGHRVGRRHRVTYLDWLPSLMTLASQQGWRIFYLGSRPGVGERAASKLREQHPGLDMHVHHGYFDARPDGPENRAVCAAINASGAEILMVGMGMPRQEQWILQCRDVIRPRVLMACGACMDYVAGEVPTPPRWMGRVGLEWAYRLAVEPRRLAYRYLVEPWQLAPHVLNDLRRRGRSD